MKTDEFMNISKTTNPVKSRLILILFTLFFSLSTINIFAQFGRIEALNSFDITFPSWDKPQSKVWMAPNGDWWCVMPTDSESDDGTWLFHLDNTTWDPILRIASNTNAHADCKVDGNDTYVLLVHGSAADLYKLTYSSETYTKTDLESSIAPNLHETATIDIDSDGRMWLAYDATNSDIIVRWSDPPYTSWGSGSEKTLITTGDDDDICAVTAFNGNKIGVLWSNQSNYDFQFMYHEDGANGSNWSTLETASDKSQIADDHINLAAHSNGKLYAAVKSTSGSPDIGLLVRNTSGIWDFIYVVDSGTGTRPIVLINENAGKIYVIYTDDSKIGADIVYKQSSISSIHFGPNKYTLISGSYNNVQSTKQNFTDNGVVILASTTTTAVGVIAYTDEPTPVELSYFNGLVNGNVIELSWRTETEINNYGFYVERSLDLTNDWYTIGFVNGNGNSNSPKDYSFTDSDVNINGTAYYRLKQIDNDGTYEYSNVVTVEMGVQGDVQLSQNYPNPFNPSTRIRFTIPERQKITLRVYNLMGELVSELVNEIREPGSYSELFDASGLPSGMYFYTLTAGRFSKSVKMSLIK
ncbi:MAG: T9SS type A sorting domain-containing protein [Ignavibacteria bacterium]|jgi:hypothetical protein